MEKGGFISDNSGALIGAAAAAVFYYGMERTQSGSGFFATLADGFLPTVFAGIALLGGVMSDMGKGQGVFSSLFGKERPKLLDLAPGQTIVKEPGINAGRENNVAVNNEPIIVSSGLPPNLNGMADKTPGRR